MDVGQMVDVDHYHLRRHRLDVDRPMVDDVVDDRDLLRFVVDLDRMVVLDDLDHDPMDAAQMVDLDHYRPHLAVDLCSGIKKNANNCIILEYIFSEILAAVDKFIITCGEFYNCQNHRVGIVGNYSVSLN